MCAVKGVWIRGQCSTPGPTYAILPNQPRRQEDKNHFLCFWLPLSCLMCFFFVFFLWANQWENVCFFSTNTTSKVPVIHFSVPVASLLFKTKDASITQPFPHSLWDELLWGKRSRVIQQLSTGNPLDCSLPPDNEWEVSLSILLNDLL